MRSITVAESNAHSAGHMKRTEANNTQAWIAAGVQQAVLSRTMPALRHELAGAVSVLRMGLAVVKRRLEASGEPQDGNMLRERVDALNTNTNELSASLRRLRHWDKPTNETMDLHALLTEVWELAKPFLLLRNIEPMPLPTADLPAEPLRPQPLMYMLLASIYHLAEGADDGTPQRIALAVQGGGITVIAEGSNTASAMPDIAHSPTPLQTPAIDRHALQSLAAHLQSPIQFEEAQRTVVLALG